MYFQKRKILLLLWSLYANKDKVSKFAGNTYLKLILPAIMSIFYRLRVITNICLGFPQGLHNKRLALLNI